MLNVGHSVFITLKGLHSKGFNEGGESRKFSFVEDSKKIYRNLIGACTTFNIA